jgi:hypothetical protein
MSWGVLWCGPNALWANIYNDFFHWAHCLCYWRTDEEKIHGLHLNLHDTWFLRSQVIVKCEEIHFWMNDRNLLATSMYDTAKILWFFCGQKAQSHCLKYIASGSSKTTTHQCLRSLKSSMPFKHDMALQNIPLSKQPFKYY